MMYPPSKEYLKKDDEFIEKSKGWIVVNPDTGKNELKPGAPQELVELKKWLSDNNPAKNSPFRD